MQKVEPSRRGYRSGLPTRSGRFRVFRATPVKSLPPERLAFTPLALRDGPLSSSAAAGNRRVLAGRVGLCHHGDGFCVCLTAVPETTLWASSRPGQSPEPMPPCHPSCQLPLSSRTASSQPPSPPAVVLVLYSRLERDHPTIQTWSCHIPPKAVRERAPAPLCSPVSCLSS